MTKATKSETAFLTMVDPCVDIDAMGRKELQALAKAHGIKANQKSAVLREKLREVIEVQQPKDEQNHKENEEVKDGNTTSSEKLLNVTTDISSPRIEQIEGSAEEDVSLKAPVDTKPFVGASANEATATSEECSILKENINRDDARDQPGSSDKDVPVVCDDTKTTQEENVPRLSTDKETNDDQTELDSIAKQSDQDDKNVEEKKSELKFAKENIPSMKEGTTVTKEGEDDTVQTTEIHLPVENRTNKSNGENDDRIGKQNEEIKQQITTNSTAVGDKGLVSTMSIGAEKDSIKKYHHSNKSKNEKFATKLDQWYRKKHVTKQTTKPPKNVSRQPTEERSSTSTMRKQSEVPLWKVNLEKMKSSHSKEKKPLPTKSVRRRPFHDRSNNIVEMNGTKEKRGKDDIKRIPAKKIPMSKRNEQQMKLFVERQAAGRKDRARREEIRKYANGDRS